MDEIEAPPSSARGVGKLADAMNPAYQGDHLDQELLVNPRQELVLAAKRTAALPPYGGVRRFVPQLPGVSELVIDYMSGFGNDFDYDLVSVERAICEANAFFDRKEYLKAMDFYAVAYEFFRFLPDLDRYFPVAHDLLVRRVICLSILGKFEQGVAETIMALAVCPNSPVVYFFQGVLFSKMNDTAQANEAFQRCVHQSADYHDLIDVLVGIFLHMGGYYDHAIAVAGKVLQRKHDEIGSGLALGNSTTDQDETSSSSSSSLDARLEILALILRADSYKFHNDGYYAPQAADDYKTLFSLTREGQQQGEQNYEHFREYFGHGFAFKNHDLVETRFIRQFSDVFENTRPRGFYEYPLFNLVRNCGVRPIAVLGLVLLCCGKLLQRSKTTRLLKRLEREQEDLRERREVVLRKIELLNAAERALPGNLPNVAPAPALLNYAAPGESGGEDGYGVGRTRFGSGEDGTIVWGPADPDLVHVKPYRRYWKERPPRTPRIVNILEEQEEPADNSLGEEKETAVSSKPAFTELVHDVDPLSAAGGGGGAGGSATSPSKRDKKSVSPRSRHRGNAALTEKKYDPDAEMHAELAEFVRLKKMAAADTVEQNPDSVNVAATQEQKDMVFLEGVHQSEESALSFDEVHIEEQDLSVKGTIVDRMEHEQGRAEDEMVTTLGKNASKTLASTSSARRRQDDRAKNEDPQDRCFFAQGDGATSADASAEVEVFDDEILELLLDAESDGDGLPEEIDESFPEHNDCGAPMLSGSGGIKIAGQHVAFCEREQELELSSTPWSFYTNTLFLFEGSHQAADPPFNRTTGGETTSDAYSMDGFVPEDQEERGAEGGEGRSASREDLLSQSKVSAPGDENSRVADHGEARPGKDDLVSAAGNNIKRRGEEVFMSAETAGDRAAEHTFMTSASRAEHDSHFLENYLATGDIETLNETRYGEQPPFVPSRPGKAILQVVSEDPNILDQHAVPKSTTAGARTTSAQLRMEQEEQQEALQLALARPVALQPLPAPTGTDWSETDWAEKALAAADAYIEREGLSPVKQRVPEPRSASVNAHLKNRATYDGEDVVDVVLEQGLQTLEDYWEELDAVNEMTCMSKCSAPPPPDSTVGTYSVTDPRSYVLPPAQRRGSGAGAGGSTAGRSYFVSEGAAAARGSATQMNRDREARQHIQRQFQGRVLRENLQNPLQQGGRAGMRS
ncbi:unnamed protein product [Amoebophrya sp. A120]|nr:unnamed protein product [Amoebophrya sp. A120]|eukprot:GSA120T00019032001.1